MLIGRKATEMADKTFKPFSLAQLFEAPDEYVGTFGWLSGYSADAAFLNDAAERFTRQTQRQRAYAGKVSLAMMLDPGNPQISCVDAPGVLHLLAKRQETPFNLMHAKVALLGFQRRSEQRHWRLRLIVSTGNWTRQTVEESLDLAWWIDLSSDELTGRPGDDTRQRCADIWAAWDLIGWLRGQYDCRALDLLSNVDPQASVEFERLIAIIAGQKALPPARFFDSREKSLLAQLPDMIRATSVGSARNGLNMGSGFYEAPKPRSAAPAVLVEIVERLRHEGLLTSSADVDVFVNPNACQAVAGSVQDILQRGWSVRNAGKPPYFGKADRSLHAKFIFSASSRSNSNSCHNAWVYLGSGNLTTPGFLQSMSPRGGNLEAGVVIAPEGLLWSMDRGSPIDQVVTNILPVQWDDAFDGVDGNLQPGGDMPEREESLVAAPVAYLVWHSDGSALQGGWLTGPDENAGMFEVLSASGDVCRREQKGVWWADQQPRQVPLRWDLDGHQCAAMVPVLDQFGRLAATVLPALEIEEAWQQLANFPMPPDDDELPDDDPVDPGQNPRPPRPRTGAPQSDYPVRQMMQLIENIAAKQTAITPVDWTAWCTRLEQTLGQATETAVLEKFQAYGLNPLSPLWHPPFRPVFAEASTSEEGQRYEDTLRRIEAAWNVSDLSRLGG
jgi:hypothetical protein